MSGIRPVAMERTLEQLTQEKGIAGGSFGIPCDEQGAPLLIDWASEYRFG